MENQPTVILHPLSGYSFGVKEAQVDEEPSMAGKMIKLQSDFEQQGIKTTVEGILLVHEHGHPHVLMLQVGTSFFKLPGDFLKPGEDEIEGMKLRMKERLAETNETPNSAKHDDFEVGELLGVWWRPNFENFMYPYLPPHIARPKEVKKLYLIHMPEKKMLSVPKNMKLLAVPLFELYDNSARYGAQLAALPQLLSRFRFIYQ